MRTKRIGALFKRKINDNTTLETPKKRRFFPSVKDRKNNNGLLIRFFAKKNIKDSSLEVSPISGFQKNKKNKKKILLIIIVFIVLIVGFLLYQLFFTEDEAVILTSYTTYGSLTRAIEGSGTTEPLDSQTVTLASQTANIEAVYVAVGDTVEVGDLLYEQDDSEIDDLISDYNDEINDLQNNLNDYETQLEEAQEGLENLTVTAPFSGRISEITVETDDDIVSGSKLALLVDDSTMTITQYVSYAYQNMVYVGIPAYVSIADQMLLLTGTVSAVDWTNYITGDGTKCFTVTISVTNPGSLTEATIAACYFLNGETKIYSVGEAKMEYANRKTINAGANGTVSSVKVSNYQQVTRGQILFTIESTTYEKQIDNLNTNISLCENQIESYEEKIEEAEDTREDYAVKAEIAGTIMEVNIEPGALNMRTVMTMSSAVTIYNLDTMTITVNIDELDVDYLTEGMDITVTRISAETATKYDAILSYISYAASSSDGVSTFPATIEIYSNGALSSGVNVSYSVNIGDNTEGVLAPIEAIQSTSEGNCVFVKADDKPNNAITLTGEDDPEVPKGFYAVPVKVGSTNSLYIIILDGIDEDTEVFIGYQQTAPTNGNTTSPEDDADTTDTNTTDMPRNMGDMPSDMGNFTPPSNY